MTRWAFGWVLVLCAIPALGDSSDLVTGLETGNLVEFAATSGLEDDGTDGSITAAARTGERGFRINDSGETAELNWLASPGSNQIAVVQVCFRTNDASPASETPIISVETNADVESWSVDLQTDGTLDFKDADGTVQISTSAISVDTFHCLEIFAETSGTGDSWLYLDGELVGNDTSGNYAPNPHHFQFTGSSGITLDFDDFYVIRNVGAATDRCSIGPDQVCNVLWFSGGAASAVPDDDCAGGTGTSLDTGNWDDLSQMPMNASTGASYTGGTSVGCIITDDVGTGSCSGGPSGCDAVGSVWLVNWVFYAERSTGSPTSFTYYVGSDSGVLSGSWSLTTSPQLLINTGKEDELSQVPDHTEYCVLGFAKDSGAQDLEAWEHWCYIANVPPAVEPHVIGKSQGTESLGNDNDGMGRLGEVK